MGLQHIGTAGRNQRMSGGDLGKRATPRIMVVMRDILTMLLLVALGTPAHAQPTDEQLGLDAHFYLILFPELRTLPAPAWLTPGVRVTYSSLASVGSAGSAISQNDVVAANGREVSVFQHAYTDIGSGVVPLYQGYLQGLPGVGGFWVNPQVLVNAERVAGNGLNVSRYDKDIAGQSVAVVRFQNDTDQSRMAYEFDSATGLMTFSSFTTNNTVTQLWLQSVRGLDIPWAPSRAPGWVRTGATNVYSGGYATTLEGSGTFTQRFDLSFVIKSAGARWSIYERQSALGGAAPDTITGISAEAQLIGALWLPRSALTIAVPAAGQLIDDDPHTGARTFIARDELGIVLQQQTSGSVTSWLYDPTTGVLMRYTQQQQSGIAVIAVDVSRTGGSDLAALAAQPDDPDDPPITPPGGNDPGNNPGGNDPGNNPGGNDPGGNGGTAPAPSGGGNVGCAGGQASLTVFLLGLLGHLVLRSRRRSA